ncbi:flagellin [Clostridia bacterium]|nr:flagellin [Clostridia bacterium]
MIINHNIPALNTYRSLTINHENTNRSLSKLSSGLRINNAGDDAAGLAISEKMRSQIRGLDQAGRNAYDGKSLLQVAEGALNETHSILQRMKELAVQSANDTNTAFDRSEIQKEIEQLKTEIDRISRDTEFNTMKLLDGTRGATATAGDTIGGAPNGSKIALSVVGIGLKEGAYFIRDAQAAATFATGNAALTGTSSSNVTLKATNNIGSNASTPGTSDAGTITFLETTKNSLGEDTGIGAKYGNYRLDISKNTAGSFDLTLHGPDGKYQVKSFQTGADAVTFDELGVRFNFGTDGVDYKITDSGYYAFTLQTKDGTGTNLAGAPALTLQRPDGEGDVNLTVSGYKGGYLNLGGLQFEGSIGLKTGGNNGDDTGVKVVLKDDSLTLHIGSNESQTMKLSVLDASSKALGVNLIDLTTQKSSEVAISDIDTAINRVSSERSKMGAIMNRLDHTIKNLGVTSENLTASESRIRDVDMAKEIMEFTKSNILAQASQSMLAQANAMPQSVLQLLQ